VAREGFELVAREEFASGLSQETWRRLPSSENGRMPVSGSV
jgi:hypothetical protein